MKVGDYVRTRWGCIAKFEGIHEKFYEFDNIIMDESCAVREELFVDIVEKSSPNIIDLIEVGDYVNGYKVLEIEKDYLFDYREEINVLIVQNGEVYEVAKKIYSDDIKSIVTKEQFSQMEYKVGE